ncbi:hypothetical protein INR49_015537 [Caranx melampygus]|nr:hypothetical protein INR49_015537 [Caranx melampygus]
MNPLPGPDPDTGDDTDQELEQHTVRSTVNTCFTHLNSDQLLSTRKEGSEALERYRALLKYCKWYACVFFSILSMLLGLWVHICLKW